MAAARSHLAMSPIVGDKSVNGQLIAPSAYVAGQVVHLRHGGDVAVLGGYAREGDVHSLLTAVASRTRNGKQAFLLIADFNRPPDQLVGIEWLERLDAEVVTADGAEATCHIGRGSLIDYVICSKRIRPYIKTLRLLRPVPWGPHDGLELELLRDARAVMVRSLRRPRPLQTELRTGAPLRDPIDWAEAMARAERDTALSPLCTPTLAAPQENAAKALGIGPEADDLGRKFLCWARALELQGLSRVGLDARTCPGALGRAAAPAIRTHPALDKPRLTLEGLRLANARAGARFDLPTVAQSKADIVFRYPSPNPPTVI